MCSPRLRTDQIEIRRVSLTLPVAHSTGTYVRILAVPRVTAGGCFSQFSTFASIHPMQFAKEWLEYPVQIAKMA